jgi:hypothetical protein
MEPESSSPCSQETATEIAWLFKWLIICGGWYMTVYGSYPEANESSPVLPALQSPHLRLGLPYRFSLTKFCLNFSFLSLMLHAQPI